MKKGDTVRANKKIGTVFAVLPDGTVLVKFNNQVYSFSSDEVQANPLEIIRVWRSDCHEPILTIKK